MNRRAFLPASAASALLAPFPVGATDAKTSAKAGGNKARRSALKKGFMLGTLRTDPAKHVSLLGKFPPLRDAPTDGLECLRRESQLLQAPAGTRLFDEKAR